MKKILFGAVVVLLMVNCSGKGASENAREESARLADSIALVEAAAADSVRQDSIAKVEAAAKYDKIVNEYLEETTKLENLAKKLKNGKNINFKTSDNIMTRCVKLDGQIKKVKNELTPEQLEKYKKGRKKWNNSIGWFVA